ncbi:ubiquitin carboxyl-terminal hydrolase [Trichoderma arundinaceum]|uniref:ubiquitinyl hydrolase 1 n=1 Tax=Trichoderma arundinaceum TaxID=490622 RepID=A0A395NP43_TRIAR|nr:ubiquitin carboxyl-terminal hydrolase [Trichoderma arundinaceum]
MGGRYGLRSEDHEPSAYATLPGTQSEFVPHNMTPMKSSLVGREVIGCHPSRWIYELINNNFTVCDLYERARRAKLDSHYAWDHPHRLVINGNQSFSTSSSKILSAICLDCHFHFVFQVEWENGPSDSLCHHSQGKWPIGDTQFPWHHLAWVCQDEQASITRDRSKYYPLLAREFFVCSAPPCTFQITLEVSEPRMASWWVNLLLDHETISQQLKAARDEEPARYESATDDWAYQGPSNLNTYLKNILEATPDATRSISKRNKRFSVLFGPRCFSIFRELEFKEKIEMNDGIDEGSFTPAAPSPADGPSGSTRIGTYRAFLEDVRSEVQNLIFKAGNTAERPTFCTTALHNHLGCAEVSNVSANKLVNLERYKLLGVLPSQSREIIVNAYKRQWEIAPSRRRDLVENLMAIANDTNDDLLSDYAITQSSVFESQLQTHGGGDDDGLVPQALEFLGLSPPNNYGADALIQAFRAKLARDPSDAVTARSMLLLIAQASNDDSYQMKLLMEADTKMSLETSKVVLGLETVDGPWQNAVDATKAKLATVTSKEAQAVYLDALDSIAEHTSSPSLKHAVMELRHARGFSNSEANDPRAANLNLPVGLHNIGNTCYLNSLLQYLFTVKPIRDIVVNYDDVRLDLNDESIQARRLGGNKMQMDRGEAVVAQAFAEEMAVLFENLRTSDRTATRPSQRLANAVLLSTHTLLSGPKQPSETPAASNPPPLPARPSPAPPTKDHDDVNMVNVSVQAVSDSLDTQSNSSTQTLVDQDDARSDRSYEKVETVVEEEASSQLQSVPIIVGDSGDDTLMAEDPQDDKKSTLLMDLDLDESMEIPVSAGQDNSDIDMADVEKPETVDQKVLNALEHQKRSSGTDQQDVEEVMGSIINRLQAAIRPTSVDSTTGIQLEKIMETFFVTTVNYTKKFDEKEYQHEISFDRSITAFPAAEGPCSLYDALGRNFDQQILEESKLSRYTAIKTLPPVLHILIQRSQSMGSKNGNPVVIPETLYLDRYMDAPHDSPIFRRRVQDWITAERIGDLKSLLAKVEDNPSYMTFLQTYEGGNESTDNESIPPSSKVDASTEQEAMAENWDFDGPVDDDFLLITPASTDKANVFEVPVGKLADIQKTHGATLGMMEEELQRRQEALEESLSSQKQISYRLHAVICHRGHLTSGHYWVWIHDFEANVWRWYNDADVKENKDTAEVLQTLSTSGEPYFLCYVRDEDKDQYVSVPSREPPKKEEEETEAKEPMVEAELPPLVAADKDEDVKVIDARPEGGPEVSPAVDTGAQEPQDAQKTVVMVDTTESEEKIE